MVTRKRYGIDHPDWTYPNFGYDSSAEAYDAIIRVYGPDTRHVVVKLVYLPTENEDQDEIEWARADD